MAAQNKKFVRSKPEGKGKSGEHGFAYKLVPYIFAVVALLLLMCFVTNLFCNPGNKLASTPGEHWLGIVGYYVCYLFFGLFGPAAFAIPVIMALFVIFWKNYTRRAYVTINSIIAFLSSITVSALLHTFIHMGGGKEAFSNNAGELFSEGAKLWGGGIVGGFTAFGLVTILNIVGTLFVLIAVLIPMILFLCGTTPVDVVKKIIEKIKKVSAEHKEKVAAQKVHEKEQAKLDKEAEREQNRLDRELEREAKKLEREQARAEAMAQREAAKAEKEAKAAEMKIENDVVETVAAYDEPIEEEPEEQAVLSVFSDEEKAHIDGIRTDDELDIKEIELAETDGEDQIVLPEVDEDDDAPDMTVFVDPKDSGERQKGFETVDHLLSERFDGVVDTETGEVFTPVVQTKAPKSADEFRAQNEQKEERFIGERPEVVKIAEYNYPPIDLLESGASRYSSDPAEVEKNTQLLRELFQDFRIPIKEVTCSCGPTLTRYEIKPEAGVRVRQIANLVDDISMTLAKTGVRIEAPIPGKAAVGIEVPNDKPAAVKLRNILEHADFVSHKSKLAACLGADVSGNAVVFDIEKMPHVLVAGTTGSGKSVCINSIIMSIMYHAKPSEVKLLLIDPKQVEFQVYRDIPHLCCRIISNPKKAAGALNLAVNEMEKRFELIREVGVRNIAGYNEITKDDPEKPYMPRMVIIIDEFADLMMTAKDEVETSVVRIAQKARAAGIHLIIGTQRPSVDVITGLIKANIPSRIAFTVMSGIDSRTILDTVGAEKLCGRGDMLYAPVGAQKPQRVQGSFVSDGEVEKVVEWVKQNNAPVIYDNEFESQLDIEAAKCGNAPAGGSGGGAEIAVGAGDDDALLFAAADLAVDSGKIATSMLQRRLSVGYGRAAKIIDRLEEMGVVGPPDGTKPRQVLMSREELEALKNGQSEDCPF